MAIKKVNACGYSSDEWGTDHKCRVCGLSECDMSNTPMIDERLYKLAYKHGWTVGKMFLTDAAVLKIRRLYSKNNKKMPLYIARFLEENESVSS